MRDDPIARAARVTLAALFTFQARYRGDAVALEGGGCSCTYAVLNERVNRVANFLSGNGLQRGARVAVLSENRFEYIELMLAAAKLGAIIAAQNWRLAVPELEHCIKLVEPHAIFVSERYSATLDAVPHGVGRVIRFGDDYEANLAAYPPSEPDTPADVEDGFIILYTSGTTGLPKGALISQRAMIARGECCYRDLPPEGLSFDLQDTFVCWAPLFHMVSTEMTLGTLCRGGTVIVMDGYDAERIAEVAAMHRIGWLVLTPGTVEPMINVLKANAVKPAGVKTVGAMADLVPLHQIAELTQLLQAPFLNSFGSTETGLPPATSELIPIGVVPGSLSKRQNPQCEVRLVDDDDREVPDGVAGEVVVRGPTLFSGYWNNPAENARVFRGGWFHMGDLLARQPDGTLNFVDRRSYMIKSGGENIYPAEIERVLMADARIAEAIVVRRKDPRWSEVPVVFVVRANPSVTRSDVLSICSGKIARYKIPKEVYFVGQKDLHRSATGKVKRYELERTIESNGGR